MADRPDIFDLLRAADPVSEADLPDHDSPHGERLLAEILVSPGVQPVVPPARRSIPDVGRSPERRRVGTRRPLALAAAIALLSVATVAAAWIVLRPVADPLGVTCYEDVSLAAPAVAVRSGGSVDATVCEPEWREARLVNADLTRGEQVPPLTACVTRTGALAVFPTDDPEVCDRLGLDLPDPESLPAAEAVRQARDRLVEYFQTDACLEPVTAAAEVRRVLEEFGLGDWTVVEQPASPERPCASFSIDAPAQTVHLVPLPLGG